MLLAVDIGNTNIKFGVFDGLTLIDRFSTPTIKTSNAVGLKERVQGRMPLSLSSAIIGNVVPELNVPFTEFLRSGYGIAPHFMSNEIDLDLNIKYEPIADAGADRLINSFAAAEKYGPPCIVCSFGTAFTIDYVDSARTLVGGLIAPGMGTLSTALRLAASRLPEVEVVPTDSLLQTTTIGSLRSGIFHGYGAMAEGLIHAVKLELGNDPKVVATGGLAETVAKKTSEIDIVDLDLTIEGLARIYYRHYTV
ncbi:MAG: type III pantothenate kinase [Acidobacteriota bacterium]|nr:MAG: type III pantothenate kinase [Acidobacteriota bacterium]